MASDAAFAHVAESLENLRFGLLQFIKRSAYVLDKAIVKTRLRPSLIVAATLVGTLLAVAFIALLRALLSINWKARFFSWVRSLRVTQAIIRREKQKLTANMEKQKKSFLLDERPVTELPVDGWARHTVVNHLKERRQRDVPVVQGDSQLSGTVYMATPELDNLLSDVYRMHTLTNPLHSDLFPSVRLMEAEVVSICGNLLNSSKVAKNICGAMTGGGSESILTAVKASRDFMKHTRGVTKPEMIIAQSAHAAFVKAAEYFNIKLVTLKVDKNYQLPVNLLRRSITKNTILIVASAPGFPHGIIDPIREISAVAQETGTLLHVDACLGGFFLPFLKKLGCAVPPFDFSLKGVTSMSIDTHKYGMAHKGTSVVLYRSPTLRKFQYTAVSEWTGGMYISPGFAGSRSGALISTAWASLMHIGESGYVKHTEKIMNAVEDFKKELSYVPDLQIVGKPVGSVVAVKLKRSPERIYEVNDMMTEKGWYLSALQLPPALHFSFTACHVNAVDRLIQDLRSSVEAMKMTPAGKKGGTAAMYGAACSVPDRRVVQDILETFQDALLSP